MIRIGVKADAPIVAKLKRLGIVLGRQFDLAKADPAVQRGLALQKRASRRIMGHFKTAGKDVNGWVFTTRTGLHRTDYLQRALVTAIGLGANRPQDAIYPTSGKDAAGQPYDGSNKYVMRFAKGQLPPVSGFWSVTMCTAEYFFVDNPLNRYNLSQRNALKPNPDGSVDSYIQKESPAPDKERNRIGFPLPRESSS